MPRLISLLVTLLCLVPAMASAMFIDVEADTLRRDGERVEARGSVVVTGEDLLVRASSLIYDGATGDLWATGDCFLRDSEGEVECEILYYNTERQDFTLENGSVIVYAEPMMISGRRISRYGLDHYTGEDLTYTSCLSDRPAWSIKTSSLDIPLEGYGRARNARFRIKGVPLLYTPGLLFPAKLKRQSGLLFPEIGASSDTGLKVSQPVYLTLGDSADLTLTPTWLRRRGLYLGAELRYRLDADSRGAFYVEALRDELGGEQLENGVNDLVADDRWFFHARHGGPNTSWDVNLVSNEDYFRDLGSMSSDYAGDFNDDTKELISRFNWYSSGHGFSAHVSAQWKQDLTVPGDDRTLQELPRLTLRMAQKRVPRTPFRVSGSFEASRFYTRDWFEGLRDKGNVGVSLPLSLGPYFTLRPFVDDIWRGTHFTDDREQYAQNTFGEHWQRRGVTLTTALYSPRFYDGWYHQLVPQAGWAYRSRVGGNADPADVDDRYPRLISGDDWTKDSDVTLSLSNYLRNRDGDLRAEISLSRTYSQIDEEWDPAAAVLRLYPVWWCSLEHRNTFDRRSGRPYATETNKTSLHLKDRRGDRLSIAGEYDRDDTEAAVLDSTLILPRGLVLDTSCRYDYRQNRYEYFEQGLVYTAQCWSLKLNRRVEPSDEVHERETTIGLTVSFLGLGDVDTSYKVDNDR